MVHDLWTNEEKEKEDDKTVEIKEEKVAVKSLTLDPPGIERFLKEEVSWRNAGDGTNYEKAVKEEPARTPSGFIPWYSGSESRRSDRPGFGWSWSRSREAESFPGQQSVGGVASSKVVSGSSADKTDAYRSPYGVGGGKSTGLVGSPTRVCNRERLPVLQDYPRAGQVSGNQSGLQSDSLSDLPPIALSNTVAHVVKSLPQFFSDSATVEKARLLWNAFEANTEGLPDQSRLLVFSQKIKGRKAERWWGTSSIRDFRTLKLRFHNHFLSRTADELWERLQTMKRERGESIEEWGDRVSELCDSLDYPDARMRYQLFRRGLRNKRRLATLDSSPVCPEATEWLMFKDMHRPIEEDDEFVGDAKALNAVASNQAAIDALSLKMDAILQAQSQQQTQNGFYQYRSPRNRSPRVDAVGTDSLVVVGYRSEGSVWEPISVLMTESLSVGGAIFLDARGKRAGASS
ncbi:hypothetical protein PHMEG_00024132 [Phytophthora megakarya]|uniref:Uncharacterized protein n=1 Tax=Phytophthora megakarya TaxID=4795 RepID=A0A225VES2_9STRA|nr:hypothetical protein PHMEG_00024132 [Phytophthora megakarya]